MKRSEVLKVLTGFIREEFSPRTEDHEYDLSLAYAVSILDLLEDAGMQPSRDPVLLLNRWEKE